MRHSDVFRTFHLTGTCVRTSTETEFVHFCDHGFCPLCSLSLSLRKSIEDEYSKILSAAISKEMHGSNLVSIISAVLSGDLSGKAVELPQEDLSALSAELSKTFASEIASGLEFRPSQSVQAGFRISEKDGSGYIDVSAEKCQELLFPYLSDSLKSIL